ncbi:hypothetical protein V6N13_043321 [Hibiscus sabdariffa]
MYSFEFQANEVGAVMVWKLDVSPKSNAFSGCGEGMEELDHLFVLSMVDYGSATYLNLMQGSLGMLIVLFGKGGLRGATMTWTCGLISSLYSRL